jgi:hypothetical protein
MSKYKTEEPWLYVDIIKPTTEEVESYYEKNDEMKTSGSAQGAISVFKKVKIIHTFDSKKYPIGSIWMMGEAPGIRVNYFGEKITMIQKINLYARIN